MKRLSRGALCPLQAFSRKLLGLRVLTEGWEEAEYLKWLKNWFSAGQVQYPLFMRNMYFFIPFVI